MDIDLDLLVVHHPALLGCPIDYRASSALALQGCGHSSPTVAPREDGSRGEAVLSWTAEAPLEPAPWDSVRVTEDGGEGVALAYAHARAGWVIRRRLRRGERADWLLSNEDGWLALEVSGTGRRDQRVGRLREKLDQVAQCTLPVSKLAVIVEFSTPCILAEAP